MLRKVSQFACNSALVGMRRGSNPSQTLCQSRRLGSAAEKVAAVAVPKEAFKLSHLLLYVPSVLCGCLTYWQLERRKWKTDLIKLKEQDLSSDPAGIFEVEEFFDYQKVTVEGYLHHEASIFVGPRARSIAGQGTQSGYLLITPVYDPNRRGVVLVNRGWVPMSWQKDPSAEATRSRKKEIVSYIGVIQPNESPNTMLFKNIPEKEQFQYIDTAAFAKCMGLPEDTPLVMAISDDPTTASSKPQTPLDAARRPSYATGPVRFPLPKNVDDLVMFTTMPQDHLNYAFTWGSLCIILAFMARKATSTKARSFRMVDGYNVSKYRTSQ